MPPTTKPEIFQLKNGMTTVLARDTCHQAVTIMVFFKVGSRDEPTDYQGITHFVEHLFFKGTKKRPKLQQISHAIDQYGGYINAATDYDTTFYYIKINRDHFETAVDILSDMLFHSLFRPKDIKTESEVVINELKMIRSNPSKLIFELLAKTHYKSTSMEMSVGGRDEVIRKADRSQIINFVKHFYRPENTLISISGNLPPKSKLKPLLEKYFNAHFDYNHNSVKPTKQFPARKLHPQFRQIQTKTRLISKVFAKTKTSYCSLAFPAWKYESPQYYTLQVIDSLLGANMSSRLFMTVREKHGLTYSINTGVSPYADLGTFSIEWGTQSDLKLLKKSLSLVFKELKRLKSQKISKAELTKAQEYLIGKDILSREKSDHVAQTNGYQWMYTGKITSPEQHYAKIRNVTPTQIQTLARQMFLPDKLSIAVIHPQPVKPNHLKDLIDL